jgi:hypothetical protein
MAETTGATGDLRLTITADVGQANKALDQLEKDAKSAGNAASVSLGKIESLLEQINAAAQSAAGSLGKPFSQANPEIDKYRSNILKLEKQVSSLQTQLDKLAKTPAPKPPEGPDVNALRAKWDPLFAISQKYKENIAEIAAAEKAGALTTATANNAREAAANIANTQMLATNKLNASMGTLNSTTKLTSNQLLNLSRQGNDALTMLASGSSIFQVAATQAGQVFGALEEGPQGLKGSMEAVKQYALSAISAIGPLNLAFGAAALAAGGLLIALKRDVEPTEDIIKRQAASVKRLTEEYNLVAPAAEAAGRRSRAAMNFEVGEQTKKDLLNLQRMAFDMQSLPGVNTLFNQRNRTYDMGAPIRKALEDLRASAKAGVPDFVAYRDALTRVAESNAPENIRELAKQLLTSSEEAEKARRSYLGVADAQNEIKTRSNEARQKLAELQREFSAFNPDSRSDAQKIRDNYVKQIAEINKIVTDNPRVINGLIDSATQQATAALDKLAEGAKQKQIETAQALANVGLKPLEKSIQETTQRYNAEIEEYKKTKGDLAGVQALEAAKLNDIARLRKEAGIAAEEEAVKIRKAGDDRIASLNQTVAQMQVQVETFGMTEGAAAAYEFRLRALAEAQRAVGENSVIPEAERAAIEAAAQQVGQYTDQLKAMNEEKQKSQRLADFEADLAFGSQIRGLSREDQAIAEKLRSVGVDYLSVQGQQYAAQMKFNDAFKETKDAAIDFQDVGESIFDTLNESLSKGEGLLKSFANMFSKLANQLASQAFGKLFGGLFNPGQPTGIGSGGGLAGAIGSALSGGGSAATPSANPYLKSQQQFSSAVPEFSDATGDLAAAAKAIRKIESGSFEGNYNAKGVITKNGDRAYGAYQMMGNNIPSWSKTALGRAISINEFLGNKPVQDAIYNKIFGGYAKKYGWEGASRAWFGGEGGMKNWNAKDAVGTSVGSYGSQFGKYFAMNGGGSGYRNTGSIDERGATKEAISSGFIDAQKKIANGQAGIANVPIPTARPGGIPIPTPRPANGNVPTPTPRPANGGGGLFSGMNGMTGAGSILGVQYPAFSAIGGIGAGLGGFSSGYSSGSPISGALTGGLSGFMQGGPIGGIIGLGAGILGGIFGGRAQRKQKHMEAAAAWEQMRPQYEAFDQSLSGKGRGNLRESIGSMWSQLESFMETGGKAWKYGKGNSSAQFAATGTKMFAKWQQEINEFQEGFQYMLEDLSGGQGLEGAFAKGRSQVKALDEQVKGFIDDVEIAFGSNDIGIPTSAAYDQMSQDTEKQRLENVAKAKKAAGDYALTMLYTAEKTSDMQNTLDSFKGTAAGLLPVLTKLGWSAEQAAKDIDERLNQAIDNLRKTFVEGFESQINDLKGVGYFNDIQELLKSRDTGISDAKLLGVDPELVTRWFNLAAQNVVDSAELTGDAFDELIKRFPELNGVVKQFADTTKETAQQIKEAAFQSAQSSFDQATSQLQTFYDRIKSFADNLTNFLDSIKLDESSPLSNKEKLDEAQKQYADTLAKANAGDADAQGNLTNAAKEYLDQAREYYASSDQYGEIFKNVESQLKDANTKATTQLDTMRSQAKWLEDINTNTMTMAKALSDYLEAQKMLNSNRSWGVEENRNKSIVSALSASGINYTGNFGGGEFQNWTNSQLPSVQAIIMDIVRKYDKIYGVNQPAATAGPVKGYATGGLVMNGVWNRDSVTAKLAGGEHITRAPSVNNGTRSMLDYINRTGMLPGSNDNSRMDGVERRLDRVIQTLAFGFNTNVQTIEEGNMIAERQSDAMKLMGSR